MFCPPQLGPLERDKDSKSNLNIREAKNMADKKQETPL